MTSKQELKEKIIQLNRDNYNNKLKLASQEMMLKARDEKIKSLTTEIDLIVHTPEFAADTESAYERGSAQAARSVAYNNILYSLDIVTELRAKLDELEQKYRRDTAYDMFVGSQPSTENATSSDLPDTDFTAKLLQDAMNKRD